MTAARSGDDPDPDAYIGDFLGYAPDPQRYDTDYRTPCESTWTLADLVPEGARVLDVGCGTGAISACLQALKNAEVVAFEPNADRASAAASRGVDVRASFLTSEALASEQPFDVVLFADVIEHLPNPGELIRLATSKLEDGGRLLISVPNIAHWSIRIGLLRGRFDYDQCGIMDATHLRWFTRSSLNRFLDNIGFEAIDIRHTAGIALPVYGSMWGPERIMTPIIRRLARWIPTLFACQFVISAAKKAKPDHLEEVQPASGHARRI